MRRRWERAWTRTSVDLDNYWAQWQNRWKWKMKILIWKYYMLVNNYVSNECGMHLICWLLVLFCWLCFWVQFFGVRFWWMYVVFYTIWHEWGGIGRWEKNKGMGAVRNDTWRIIGNWVEWPNRSKMMIGDEGSNFEFFSYSNNYANIGYWMGLICWLVLSFCWLCFSMLNFVGVLIDDEGLGSAIH